jgi:hypothetical protein
MNELQDMIRDASHATAREVDPASLPAPRLPVGQRRARPHSGSNGMPRTAFRRWAAPAAAAAAVAAVAVSAVVVSAGPGQAPAGHRHHAAQRAASGQLSPTQITTINDEVIGLFIPATGAQYTAGAQLWGTIKSLGLAGAARCTAAEGFTTRVGIGSPAFWASIYQATELTQPDLAQMSRDGSLAPIIASPTAPGGSKRFQAHLNACISKAGQPFQPIFNAGYALAGPWLPAAELTRIRDSAREQATLPQLDACATSHGAPPGSITSYQSFTSWISGQLPIIGQVGGVSTAVLNRRRRHLEPIFVTCARPYIAVQNAEELALQKTFLRRHHAKVEALEALARRVIGKQQRLAGIPVTG